MSEVTENAAPEQAAPPEQDINAAIAQVFGEDAPKVEGVAPGQPANDAKPAPPAPVPLDERASARIIAAKRASLRGAEVHREIANQRAELEKGRAELAELAKVAEQVKAAKLSPSKALELLGLDAKTFLESLATEHEPSAITARAVAVEQTEREKLAAEVKQLREERERERQEREQAEYQRAVHANQRGFVEHVAASDAYPHLVSEYDANEIAKAGWEVALKFAENFRAKEGRAPREDETPDDSDIAAYLEKQAKARVENRAAWHAQIGKKVQPPSQGNSTGDQKATQSVPGPSPRTLTSRAASEKATAPPANMTQEQADEECLRIIEASLKNTG